MLIYLFILIPLFALLLCFLFPNRFERSISGIAVTSILAVFGMFLWTLYLWAGVGFEPFSQPGLTLFPNTDYAFNVNFYMDAVSAVFFVVTCLITVLVLFFSKYYMHRDSGFRRFHATILLFFVGLALIIFSGNFETLFVGWEFIGMSSFLLIAFYRDRFLPIKNGLKVFSLYRIADAFLILAIWYAHHVFGHSVEFGEFASVVGVHGNMLGALGALFLIVAAVKSAQFPFSYWLPRAMEGPTTSSAIFYGALSVHVGLFLMLRTYPLWEGSGALRFGIVVLGLVTALIATSITRVQSSVKTQIAYASVTQIGIMFIELGAGLHWLVLFHFVSNACLRTYQLLISPSILSYLIHYQFYTFEVPTHKIRQDFMGKIRSTLFVLGIKEWNMDSVMTHIVWQPLKQLGQKLKVLDSTWALFVCALLALIGALYEVSMWAGGILSLLLFVRAYANKGSPLVCWTQIFLGQLFGCFFMSALGGAPFSSVWLYLGGIVAAYLIGAFCLARLGRMVGSYTLMDFHGNMYAHPILGSVFFFACLAMMVFPITPSFVGEEMLLNLIALNQSGAMVIVAVGYIFSGICSMRIFAKVFFGPHKKTYHEIAYRSS